MYIIVFSNVKNIKHHANYENAKYSKPIEMLEESMKIKN